MKTGIGFVEITGLTPTIVVLDAMDKAADIQLLEIEFNDYYGAVIKVKGMPASLEAALQDAHRIADQMQVPCVTSAINAPDPRARDAIEVGSEYNEILKGYVVRVPQKEKDVSGKASFAIGLIETQGYTAVFEAVDAACKAANVEVICREKLGGGYITVLIKGDVAAVEAAVQAGKAKVDGLGKLIAAHVIARPSEAALSILSNPPEKK